MEYQIELARRYGRTNIILLTGHLGEVVEDYFDDGSRWGVSIHYHRETTPLGTAGALKEIEDRLDDDFLVFYGDTIMDVDLSALAGFHAEHRPVATLVVHPNSHPYDSDLLELGRDQRIVAFHAKPRSDDRCYGNCANAALYVISRKLLHDVCRGECADLGKKCVSPRTRSWSAALGLLNGGVHQGHRHAGEASRSRARRCVGQGRPTEPLASTRVPFSSIATAC